MHFPFAGTFYILSSRTYSLRQRSLVDNAARGVQLTSVRRRGSVYANAGCDDSAQHTTENEWLGFHIRSDCSYNGLGRLNAAAHLPTTKEQTERLNNIKTNACLFLLELQHQN